MIDSSNSSSLFSSSSHFQPLEKQTKMNLCPLCQAEVPENETICPFCGTPLNETHWKSSSTSSLFDTQITPPPQIEETLTDDLPSVVGVILEEESSFLENDILEDIAGDIAEEEVIEFDDLPSVVGTIVENEFHDPLDITEDFEVDIMDTTSQSFSSTSPSTMSYSPTPHSSTSQQLKNFFQRRQHYQPPELKDDPSTKGTKRLYWEEYRSLPYPDDFWTTWLNEQTNRHISEKRIIVLGFDPTQTRIEPLLKFFAQSHFEIQLASYPTEGITLLFQEIPDLFLIHFSLSLTDWAPLIRTMARSPSFQTIPLLLFCDMPLDGMLLSSIKELNAIVFYKTGVQQNIII